MKLYPDSAYDPATPPSYWATTAPEIIAANQPLADDVSVGTAVIGGGFTGLNAALGLAEKGEDVAIFDASHPGWGASGRNGGFVCMGGTKQDYSVLLQKFGEEETRAYINRQRGAIDHVASILERFNIDADRHSDGEWLAAHRPSVFERMTPEVELEQSLGLPSTIYSRAEMAERGMAGPHFHGGVHLNLGFAVNPMKYLAGLVKAAQNAGATIYSHSRVTKVTQGDRYSLTVNGHKVTAKRLIYAANGYAKDGFIDWMTGRFLPVLSSIIVTRPLTDAEMKAQGWWAKQATYDSRTMLHYFRLLPENRFMFGMRGGSSLSPRADAKLARLIRSDFEKLFPAWSHVETDYRWTGLLSLARDKAQYVGPLGDWPNAWTAHSYHGNGVAMGSYSGKLLADSALGQIKPIDLPAIMRGPLRRFPAHWARMAYIKAYYLGWDISEILRR
ncbi:MAG: NAD(P)/FAD-dependent oxidoreductase [Pikeienuella sp.]